VLAADDGRAAVEALVRDAVASDANGRATSPTSSTVEGVKVTRASFVIDAGGWSFDAVAVEADGDPWATVYVTSAADRPGPPREKPAAAIIRRRSPTSGD